MVRSYSLKFLLQKAKQKVWGIGEIQKQFLLLRNKICHQLWGHLRAEICSREADKNLLSILRDMLKMLYN